MNTRGMTILTVAGAFTAYCIGAGFASGQETLQFFGAFGGMYPFILPITCFILMFLFCYGTYKTGAMNRFNDPNAAYTYYCGKYLGRAVDWFCTLSIALCTLIMFAGSGATINQYLGLPVYVGTVFMGIIAVIVVCLGLEKVTDVLGCAGVIIIAIMFIVGIYNITTSPISIMEGQQHVLQYVAEGRIVQGAFMGIHEPFIAQLFLIGAYVALGVVFNVALGSRCRSQKEILGSAILSAAFFTFGVILVLATMLLNLDYIASIKAQVPMLAAIENSLPALALPFSIIILIGVFTTITGYLWAFGRRFAEDKTKKQRIIVIIVAVIGVTIASRIPLAQLVNAIYPVVGIAGVLLLIGIIYRMFTDKETSSNAVSESTPSDTVSPIK